MTWISYYKLILKVFGVCFIPLTDVSFFQSFLPPLLPKYTLIELFKYIEKSIPKTAGIQSYSFNHK